MVLFFFFITVLTPVQTHAYWFGGQRRGWCTVPAAHSVSLRPLAACSVDFGEPNFCKRSLEIPRAWCNAKSLSDFTLVRPNYHQRSVSVRSEQKERAQRRPLRFRLNSGAAHHIKRF